MNALTDPSTLRFLVRTGIVTLAVITVLVVLVDMMNETGKARSDAYCLHQNNYYSKGAFEETAGVMRLCAVNPADPDEPPEWVDPR